MATLATLAWQCGLHSVRTSHPVVLSASLIPAARRAWRTAQAQRLEEERAAVLMAAQEGDRATQLVLTRIAISLFRTRMTTCYA